MNRLLKQEEGYTLFLSLLIIILFTGFAFLMIGITMNGMKKNIVREEYVQATELADKGIKHITHQINAELQEKLGDTGLIRSHFADELNDILEKYTCENENSIEGKVESGETETGTYKTCIDKIPDETSVNELHKEIVFKSNGKSIDGKERELKTTVEIGAKEVPDALKYAIGTDGNLFLHGASNVEGDVKVDGNIITTDRGYAYLNGDQWIPSLFPSIKPGPSTRKAKLVLGGNVYTFDKKPYYKNHISRNVFSSRDGYRKVLNMNHAFSHAPELVQRKPIQEKFNITDQESNYKYSINEADIVLNRQKFNGNNYLNKKIFAYEEVCYFLWGCSEVMDYFFNGNNTFSQFATRRNLHIRNAHRSFGSTKIINGMYIGGNLTVGNLSNSYNPNYYDKIKIDGPIYVNGDLIIKGADAKLNTLIYVNGNVTIENSRINGLNVNNKEGSLIIFANGEVKISNNSVNLDEPSRIKGYFYSNEVFEMYGVGSNIRIEGGISAQQIVLNAIRGRASNNYFVNSQRVKSKYYEERENQADKPSRLQVIYNPEIINTYSNLKQQEPVIYNVDPPKEIKRE